jgi:hypothetical protein
MSFSVESETKRAKYCEECEDCECNNEECCNDEKCCKDDNCECKNCECKKDERCSSGDCSDEECCEEENEDKVQVLEQLVYQLRKEQREADSNLLDKEIQRLINIAKNCDNYDIIDIINGRPVHIDLAVPIPVDFIEANSLFDLNDGKYVRFMMLRNNFVNEKDFKDAIKDCFDHFTTVLIESEYTTERYYIFYIKIE